MAGVVLLCGLAALSFTQHRALAALRQQQCQQEEALRELDRLRAETQELQKLRDQETEIEQLRESNRDLMRLRNEVTQLRKQLAELEVLRTANAKLLQAVQGTSTLPSNQMALVTAARKQGAILGVTVQPAPVGQSGIVVTSVDAGSPVAGSGILPGDLIFALDGRPMQTPGQLQSEMLSRTPGEVVLVDVLRTNATHRFQVRTRDWPQ